jgi:dipeptidyl aminopeptidase/acylaminoacyl peptidase
MLQGFHYMGYYSKDYGMNQYYASKGYIVLAVNYRSGIGYGMEFREALHYGANGGSEYYDVVAAGQWLQKRTDINSKRIGLWGGSYGGYLTAMGLSRNSDIFACGVDIHGVHDWNQEMKNWVANYDPSTRAAFAKIALAASPISTVDGWRSPVLFIHGDDDRNVPFEQTEMMAEKLRERKVYFEELVFPDDIHDFLLHKNWLKGYHSAADFFERKMK